MTAPLMRLRTSHAWGAVLLLLAIAALILWSMGRPLICTCGTVKLWAGTVNGPDNSQHLIDWYSPSHLIHGLLLYAATHLLMRGRGFGARLVAATAVEAAWVVLENSQAVIDRYREVTMALGYYGDSVLNSLSDIGWMVIGFMLARRLPVRASIALGVGLELFTLALIRDNLTLNVLMLVWPLDSVRAWQAGG